VHREIGRLYPKPKGAGGDWLIAGDDLRGRLVWADPEGAIHTT
jgi:hypothetical protein